MDAWCASSYEMRKESGNFTFRWLLFKRFNRYQEYQILFLDDSIPVLIKKTFCYSTLRWYWVNSIWDKMRDELAIILLDDFCPIQQLNAKKCSFCIFSSAQFCKALPGIGRHSLTFWMIDVFFQMFYYPRCTARKNKSCWRTWNLFNLNFNFNLNFKTNIRLKENGKYKKGE